MKTTTIKVASVVIQTTEGPELIARAQDAIGRAVERRRAGRLPGIPDELLLQMAQAAELPDALRALVELLAGDVIDTTGEDVTPPSISPRAA